jgi:hypothetical protein
LLKQVRFCSLVAEFERFPLGSVERRTKGAKICSLFIQHGARFEIESLPSLYIEAVQKDVVELLPDARMECLQCLALEEDVVRLCRMKMAS